MGEALTDIRDMWEFIGRQEAIIDWQTIKAGSYCKSRTLRRSGAVLVSAAFIGPTFGDYELNLIATPDINNPTATLRLLMHSGNKRREIYRIDYSNANGWHLDSNNYGGIQHRPLSDVTGWRNALLKISHALEYLPLEFPEVLNSYSNPEITLNFN